MRVLKTGTYRVPDPPFGDYVVTAGGALPDRLWDAVPKADRKRFKLVKPAAPAADDPDPSDS